MTPREELTELMVDKFESPVASSEMISDTTREIESDLKTFAVGRWVKCSDRLPEFDHVRRFMGVCKYVDGSEIHDYFHESQFSENIVEWLDLDLPTQKEGA